MMELLSTLGDRAPPGVFDSGGNEACRRCDGPTLLGLRRLFVAVLLADGRFFWRGSVEAIGGGGDAMDFCRRDLAYD